MFIYCEKRTILSHLKCVKTRVYSANVCAALDKISTDTAPRRGSRTSCSFRFSAQWNCDQNVSQQFINQSRSAISSLVLTCFVIVQVNVGWLGSRVVSMLDSGAVGPGFKSQSLRCRVTALGKLFTPIVPLFTKQQNWVKGCEGNCRPGGK